MVSGFNSEGEGRQIVLRGVQYLNEKCLLSKLWKSVDAVELFLNVFVQGLKSLYY